MCGSWQWCPWKLSSICNDDLHWRDALSKTFEKSQCSGLWWSCLSTSGLGGNHEKKVSCMNMQLEILIEIISLLPRRWPLVFQLSWDRSPSSQFICRRTEFWFHFYYMNQTLLLLIIILHCWFLLSFTQLFIYVIAHYSFLHLKPCIFGMSFSENSLLTHSLHFFLKVF